MYVYIAGPLTSGGDTAMNVRRALSTANKVYELGHIPFVPHLSHFWHMLYPDQRPHETSKWMKMDRAWLEKCSIMIRLPGKSKGADIEEGWAEDLGIPVMSLKVFTEVHQPPREEPSIMGCPVSTFPEIPENWVYIVRPELYKEIEVEAARRECSVGEMLLELQAMTKIVAEDLRERNEALARFWSRRACLFFFCGSCGRTAYGHPREVQSIGKVCSCCFKRYYVTKAPEEG